MRCLLRQFAWKQGWRKFRPFTTGILADYRTHLRTNKISLCPCSKASFIVQIERLFGISPFLALKVLISTLSHVIVLRKELWCIQSAYCTALFTQTQTPIRNCSQEIIKYLVLTYWIRAEVKAWALKIIIIIISEGHQKVVKWVRFLRLVRPTHELNYL